MRNELESTEKSVFRVKNLACQRDSEILFSNLTFNLTPGKLIQVTGPNGSGKSSLLKVLVGLLPRESGEIFWKDKSIHFPHADFIQNVRYLGHKLGLQLQMTVLENLKNWRDIQGIYFEPSSPLCGSSPSPTSEERGSEDCCLRHWGLLDIQHARCDTLSQGQKQRLALARLSLSPAMLWVLDEPCTSLDAEGLSYFETSLERHLKGGGMAIIASHSHAESQFNHDVIYLPIF